MLKLHVKSLNSANWNALLATKPPQFANMTCNAVLDARLKYPAELLLFHTTRQGTAEYIPKAIKQVMAILTWGLVVLAMTAHPMIDMGRRNRIRVPRTRMRSEMNATRTINLLM